jgi:hypothetical protein
MEDEVRAVLPSLFAAAGAECSGAAGFRKFKRRGVHGRIKVATDNLSTGSGKRMAYSKEDAVARARADLATRLGVPDGEIGEESVEQADFPDTALGAPTRGEMSGMMMTSGWRIRLGARGRSYEYRADRNQLRLYNFNGANHKI